MIEEPVTALDTFPRYKNFVFTKPKVVIAEGPDEAHFFPRLLRLGGSAELSESMDFIDCDSKSKLERLMRLLPKVHGFRDLTSVGIVLDSDGDPLGFDATFAKSQNALRLIGFPIPDMASVPKTSNGKTASVWIMPDNGSVGEFEDLCLKALAAHPLMNCVNGTEKCVLNLQLEGTARKLAKPRLYTFLAWLDHRPGRRMGECDDSLISEKMDLGIFQPLINDFFAKL